MKKIYCLLFVLLFSISAFSQRPFVIKYSGSTYLYLKTTSGFHYQYEKIGNPAINGQGERTGGETTIMLPTYLDNYLIKIYPIGKFKIEFVGGGSASGVQEVSQWGDIQWDNDLSVMFQGCSNLIFTATDKPNFSNVTNMRYMFDGATKFNSPINDWDMSNVTNIAGMFRDAENFNQPLNNWNVGNVTRTNEIFLGALKFNQNLNSWNVSKVTHMDHMFEKAKSFNQPLNSWNVSNVKNLVDMFANATSFNQPLNSWNVSNVESLFGMFANATSFNQPLDSWNVTNNKTLNHMFYNASSFNQSLGSWNLQNVDDGSISDFLTNSGIDCDNYGKSLKGWAENTNTNLNLRFSSKNIKYNKFGEIYREKLKDEKSWNFEDNSDILDANCGTYLSLNETVKTNTVIFPNPTSSLINIKSNKTIKMIELLDVSGKIIKATSNQEQISLEKNPVGNYTLKITYTDGTISVKKIIKN